ncbi:hypothetical protein FBEOM_470 [Fusarium beomiforme]|uniref:Haloacid dehalogenase n=1 Tax=Fusarium beomiforme TaxID=44412 RepID=A0A9P5E4Z4_9HYPO|nr:hypothetical protein FBEOM_470 [Fusarium beomiforme]
MDTDHRQRPSVERPEPLPSAPPTQTPRERVIFFSLNALYDYKYAEECALEACRQVFPDLGSKTIQEVIEQYYEAINEAFISHLGNSIGKDNDGTGNARRGKASTNKVDLLFELLKLPQPDDHLRDRFQQVFRESFKQNRRATEGAINSLRYLKHKGFKSAIIEDGFPEVHQETVNAIGLAPYIDHIFTSEPSGIRKPDKRIFETSMEHYNIRPQDTWIVGVCKTNDIEGIIAAGARPVLYEPGNNDLSMRVNGRNVYILPSMADLPPFQSIWRQDTQGAQGQVQQPVQQQQAAIAHPQHNQPPDQQVLGFPPQSSLQSSAQLLGSGQHQNAESSHHQRHHAALLYTVDRSHYHGSLQSQSVRPSIEGPPPELRLWIGMGPTPQSLRPDGSRNQQPRRPSFQQPREASESYSVDQDHCPSSHIPRERSLHPHIDSLPPLSDLERSLPLPFMTGNRSRPQVGNLRRSSLECTPQPPAIYRYQSSQERLNPRHYAYSYAEDSRNSEQHQMEVPHREPVEYGNPHPRSTHQLHYGYPPQRAAGSRQEPVQQAHPHRPTMPHVERRMGLGEQISRVLNENTSQALSVPPGAPRPSNPGYWETAFGGKAHKRTGSATQHVAHAPTIHRPETSPYVNSQPYHGSRNEQAVVYEDQEIPRPYQAHQYQRLVVQPNEVPTPHRGLLSCQYPRCPNRHQAESQSPQPAPILYQQNIHPAHAQLYEPWNGGGNQLLVPREAEYHNGYSKHGEARPLREQLVRSKSQYRERDERLHNPDWNYGDPRASRPREPEGQHEGRVSLRHSGYSDHQRRRFSPVPQRPDTQEDIHTAASSLVNLRDPERSVSGRHETGNTQQGMRYADLGYPASSARHQHESLGQLQVRVSDQQHHRPNHNDTLSPARNHREPSVQYETPATSRRTEYRDREENRVSNVTPPELEISTETKNLPPTSNPKNLEVVKDSDEQDQSSDTPYAASWDRDSTTRRRRSHREHRGALRELDSDLIRKRTRTSVNSDGSGSSQESLPLDQPRPDGQGELDNGPKPEK